MSDRQMRTRLVLSLEEYDGAWMPENLSDAIAWLSWLRASIPAKYRDDASIEIDSRSGYEGSSYAGIRITYQSPETDAEKRDREAEQEQRVSLLEVQERSQLAALVRRYGLPVVHNVPERKS